MIALLRGILVDAPLSQEIIIDVNGVGYEVLLPGSSFSRLPRTGEEVTLLVHTVVREDAITLFGFLTQAEKDLFKILISVSGVGGKLANSILGAMSVESFCTAVQTKNTALLSKIPGIGKRTAERLAVELAGKLDRFDIAISEVSGSDQSLFNDTMQALTQLGFKKEHCHTVLKELIAEHSAENLTVEILLRYALGKVSK
ncbi:MAG: Holliday junction branch migration protein RuvA [Lentisphaeria bacterium]|nr:Holliday junction branch migration protein RuvA [Lentisphaeria bacterium]